MVIGLGCISLAEVDNEDFKKYGKIVMRWKARELAIRQTYPDIFMFDSLSKPRVERADERLGEVIDEANDLGTYDREMTEMRANAQEDIKSSPADRFAGAIDTESYKGEQDDLNKLADENPLKATPLPQKANAEKA